jgi:hypothetical protein
MVNPGNAISAQALGDCTAEARRARSKEFLIKKYSELCELCASVVNTPSQFVLLSWVSATFERWVE